ncbi:MAG: hypothetical protein M3R10_08905 [Verrucomicrobiota bacterium]|nr:hypothetical protein [Verrucomicrobiota bacterium]
MSFADLFARMKLSQKDAEIIFDRHEPIGEPTDMVMPRRRWFRKKAQQPNVAPSLKHSILR